MNLAELRDGLETCTDGSIFYHTFQSLERHHFLAEGFSNDFAQWILAAVNCPELAEQLAEPDIRVFSRSTACGATCFALSTIIASFFRTVSAESPSRHSIFAKVSK
jgi:hypothetical protein